MKKNLLFLMLPAFLFLSSCGKHEVPEPLSAPEANDPGWSMYSIHDNMGTFIPKRIALDNMENIWYAGNSPDGKVFLQERSGNIITSYSAQVSVLFGANCAVTALEFDANNDLWIGVTHTIGDSAIAGLVKYDGTAFQAFDLNNAGAHTNNVHSIAVDENNVKWIGTDNVIAKYDGSTWTYYDRNNSLFRDFYPIFCTTGYVWVAGLYGLARFDGTTLNYFPSYGSLADKDPMGNLWFEAGYNLIKFDGVDTTEYPIPLDYINPPHGSPIPVPYAVLRADRDGNVFVMREGNMAEFDVTTHTWKKFKSPKFSSHWPYIYASFTDMVQVSSGRKWFTDVNFTSDNLLSYDE